MTVSIIDYKAVRIGLLGKPIYKHRQTVFEESRKTNINKARRYRSIKRLKNLLDISYFDLSSEISKRRFKKVIKQGALNNFIGYL